MSKVVANYVYLCYTYNGSKGQGFANLSKQMLPFRLLY